MRTLAGLVVAKGTLLALACALSTAACGADQVEETVSAVRALDSDISSAEIPSSPVGRRLAWLLDVLNGRDGDGPLAPHFTPSFLGAVSEATLAGVLEQYAARAPWEIAKFDGEPAAQQIVAVLIDGDRRYERLTVVVEAQEPFRIAGMFLAPAGDLDPELRDPARLEARVGQLAESADYLVAEIGDDGCRSIQAANASARLAIGSAFKLYVLGTVARRVEEGR